VAGFGSASVVVSENEKEFVFCLNKTTEEDLTFMFLLNSESAVDGRGTHCLFFSINHNKIVSYVKMEVNRKEITECENTAATLKVSESFKKL